MNRVMMEVLPTDRSPNTATLTFSDIILILVVFFFLLKKLFGYFDGWNDAPIVFAFMLSFRAPQSKRL